jgi:hypothetical protein
MTAATSLLSFVACASNDKTLGTNLLASPCLAPHSAHQVLVVRNWPSAADGLNIGIARSETEWVVCVHQDVWHPAGWDRCIAEQLDEAEQRFGPIGVAGVYGVGEVIAPRDGSEPLAAERIGWVVDRGRVLRDVPELPTQVATLDELLLIVKRDSGLRFDAALGFHLDGADICLQASERGPAVVALGAPCHHNSRSIGLPEAFFASARVFARKWRHRLPDAAPCAIIDSGGEVYVLGNATERPGSVAIAVRYLRLEIPQTVARECDQPAGGSG